jgi:CDP-3, 6-dideoxy-D-glycero-L-glycero-4-hexulose-4-reductase
MSKTILVTGSRGVIGTNLCKILRGQGHRVIGTRRPTQEMGIEEEITITPWEKLPSEEFKYDLVIHLAGVYLTKYEVRTIEACFDTNAGLAASVASLQMETKVPVIALGSFFERAPNGMQPWTFYAASKKSSHELLKESTQISESKLVYLYIYDTYGSKTSRGKFIDLLVDSINSRQQLEASEGNQMQDLTHIDDVASAISQTVIDIEFLGNGTHEFQVRSQESVTLRKLVEIANSKLDNKIKVNWGKFPYRKKEVFELWDSAINLPNWKAQWNLEDYFASINTAIRSGGNFE